MGAMIDYYAPAAEFYDMIAVHHTADRRSMLAHVLEDVPTRHGPVLEIGAGTGRVTEVIAACLPDAEILAAEPSPVMRAQLMSRVSRTPDLRRRVTVTDGAAQDLDLPERISAAVLCGVAGHLTESERTGLWRRLSERMPQGGPIIVELMVGTLRHVPPTMSLRETIGEQTYEWWISGEPVSNNTMRFVTKWKVLRAGRTVREVRDNYLWHVFDLDQLANESGLTARLVTGFSGDAVREIAVLTK